MDYKVCDHPVPNGAIARLWILAFIWLAGFSLGTFSGSASDPSYSMMLQLSQKPMSIVGLLGVICLSFLLTAFAVYFQPFYGLILVAFLKAFSFGFVSVLLKASFGSVHWFPRGMLMFSDLGCITVLGILWHRLIHGDGSYSSIAKATIFSLAFGLVDISVVAPLLETSGLF